MGVFTQPRARSVLGAVLAAVVLTGHARGQDARGDVLVLTGIVRDFRERTEDGGHPDFELRPDQGYRLYTGNVETYLDDDGKPVFSGEGVGLRKSWADAKGRKICRCMARRYPTAGDQAGKVAEPGKGGVQSAKSFQLWFRDQPGINMAAPLAITFFRRSDGAWVFDDELDETYEDLGGFFPIDGQLFGNSASVEGVDDHNFHFTVELHATFTWTAGTGRFLEVRGDDDLWVFVNDELVIDLGGVHRAKSQFVLLERLGLVDGATCRLDIFFADRHRMHSKLGIVTNVHGLRAVANDADNDIAAADAP